MKKLLSESLPQHNDELLEPPAHSLPDYLARNIPAVAQDLGRAEVCDGKTSLGRYGILNGRLGIDAYTRYDDRLLAIARGGGIISDTLGQNLHTRIASNLLKPREHALITLSNISEYNNDLVRVALAHLKAAPARALQTLHEAEKLGLAIHTVATSGAQGGVYEATATIASLAADNEGTGQASHYSQRTAGGLALVKALASYHQVNMDAVPAYQPTVLEPAKALEQHIKDFGGPVFSAQQLRSDALGLIASRYQQEFQGKRFYFDPITALGRIYDNTKPKWRMTHDPLGWYCSGLAMQRFDRGLSDEYGLGVRGPNKQAAQRGAARLVLQYLGATKIGRFTTRK